MTPANNAASYSRQPVRDYGESVSLSVCLFVCSPFEKKNVKERSLRASYARKKVKGKPPRVPFVEDSVDLAARARARARSRVCFYSARVAYESRENVTHHVARATATRSWLRVVRVAFAASARRRMFVRGSKPRDHVISLSRRSVGMENRDDIFGEKAHEHRGWGGGGG